MMKPYTEADLEMIRAAASHRGLLYRDHVVRDATAIHVYDGQKYRLYDPLDLGSADFFDLVKSLPGLTIKVTPSGFVLTYEGFTAHVSDAATHNLGREIVRVVQWSKEKIDVV